MFIFLSNGRNDVNNKGIQELVSELKVTDVLLRLGGKVPNHHIYKLNKDSVAIGYELITKGKLEEKNSKRLSKFFVCIDCHNTVKEVADLSVENTEERLAYGMANDLPFLPASTFYGLYNKTHWYNGDYELKYGDLVKPARDSLIHAIQLCAVQCSQGRPMESWELNAVLHYFKSIELSIADLNLSPDELVLLSDAIRTKDKKGIQILKDKYTQANSATFGEVEIPVKTNYQPNINHGAYIFKNGCLHCHGMGKNISNFEFDESNLTLSFLKSQLEKASHFTVPYLVRKGTYAVNGKRQYMPQYTLEKMSEEQMLDLLAYISTKKQKE
ncbi:c-type cytochrome [Putridiphycobacter roseus]|nr:cytochrome c [Putridiphycobacter roseus]